MLTELRIKRGVAAEERLNAGSDVANDRTRADDDASCTAEGPRHPEVREVEPGGDEGMIDVRQGTPRMPDVDSRGRIGNGLSATHTNAVQTQTQRRARRPSIAGPAVNRCIQAAARSKIAARVMNLWRNLQALRTERNFTTCCSGVSEHHPPAQGAGSCSQSLDVGAFCRRKAPRDRRCGRSQRFFQSHPRTPICNLDWCPLRAQPARDPHT